MFRFEQIEYLYVLVLIPVLLLLYYVFRVWVNNESGKLSEANLFKKLSPHFSWAKKNLKFSLLLLALAFICIAWANPQWGNKKEKVRAQSSDVFIALDISQSMMAEDISPNRLERAKRLTQNIVRSLKGNRIGLIYFAGSAYLQMPLSNDYSAAEIFLSSANTNQAGTQGTAIVEAIDLALRAFENDKDYQRSLIIVTDGESHDEEAVAKAEEALSKGLVVFTVGIGTEEGGFIPYVDRGREQYKRDENGNPVKSALNIDLLKSLASSGGGEYFLVQEGNQIIADLKNEIDRLEKQEVEQRSFSEYASYFQYFLAFGILLLFIEYLISNRGTLKQGKSIFEI